MSMDLSATYAALQALHLGIAGIKTAPTDRPTTLPAADLPCVLSWLAPGEWTIMSKSYEKQKREWIVRFYYAPQGQGVGIAPAAAILAFFALFPRAYFANQTLGGVVDHIQSCRDQGDDGILVYGGTVYYGFEMRVLIVEKGTA